MLDLGLATCQNLPEPDPDADILAAALAQRNVRFKLLAWDDPGVDWSQCRVVLIRSTWNYLNDRDGFITWANDVQSASELHNPAVVVDWNTNKTYLAELERAGVLTVPTEFVSRKASAAPDLAKLLEARGWDQVVVKPSVSAGSFATHQMSRDSLDQGLFETLVAARDMMVQPFVESVEQYGERSLVHFHGELSHVIRKAPRFGTDAEAITGPFEPTDAERALARDALGAAAIATGVTEPLLYARVDIANNSDGEPMIMELELTEPSLFFAFAPGSVDRLCDLLIDRIRR